MGEVERLLEATARHWDCSGEVPLPRPGWLRCGFCTSSSVQVRYWRFHRRDARGATWPYRCDVSLKCRSCAALWYHGIAVPVELWERRPADPRGLRLFGRSRSEELPIWERDYRRARAAAVAS